MKKNIGTADQVIRVLVAIAIAVLYFMGQISGVLAIVLLALAGIFIVTSIVGVCPLYLPFGLSTRKKPLNP